MLVIEVEVDKSVITKTAFVFFIALGEYLIIRKIKRWE